jgi:hypothetical protein
LSILYSKIPGFKTEAQILKRKIRNNLSKKSQKPDYQLFLTLLSFYYQKDYFSILKIIKKFNQNHETDLPCSVLAANAVIMKISGKQTREIEQQLMTFYHGNGSFSALKNSPVSDLLSTAVALFALKVIDSDLRKIKPDCLEYIDSLYLEGSFRATSLDSETDIEYKFYGLLALGSLF